jgi:glycosyltransferase involved in cell wall biosynthesis
VINNYFVKPLPLVSYIVPCYNNAPFVIECLESIKAQRKAYPNIEIVFVDDGSTDKSYAYAYSCLCEDNAEVGHADPHYDMTIKLPNNKGVGHALNIGFDWAKGEYLCFFAADDILLDAKKTFYQQMIMESTGADISYYLDWYQGTGITDMKRVSGKWAPDYLPIGYLLKNYIHMSKRLFHWYLMHHDPINSGSFMITRKAYQMFGKWDETVLTTDYELLLRYCSRGAKFCPIQGAPMLYRFHKGQSSFRTTEMQEGILETQRKHR